MVDEIYLIPMPPTPKDMVSSRRHAKDDELDKMLLSPGESKWKI